MSLIQCPTCGREISKNAVSCPHCGEPMSTNQYNPEEWETQVHTYSLMGNNRFEAHSKAANYVDGFLKVVRENGWLIDDVQIGDPKPFWAIFTYWTVDISIRFRMKKEKPTSTEKKKPISTERIFKD